MLMLFGALGAVIAATFYIATHFAKPVRPPPAKPTPAASDLGSPSPAAQKIETVDAAKTAPQPPPIPVVDLGTPDLSAKPAAVHPPARKGHRPPPVMTPPEKDCVSGLASACFDLAFDYEHGTEQVPKDKARAQHFYELACRQHLTQACAKLKHR